MARQCNNYSGPTMACTPEMLVDVLEDYPEEYRTLTEYNAFPELESWSRCTLRMRFNDLIAMGKALNRRCPKTKMGKTKEYIFTPDGEPVERVVKHHVKSWHVGPSDENWFRLLCQPWGSEQCQTKN